MNSYRVILTPTAEKCLLEIAEYVALDNPVRAYSFIDEIAETLRKTLSLFPLSGKVCDIEGVNAEIRTLPHKGYTSYYHVNEKRREVHVLFVFNARREIAHFLQNVGN